MSAPLRDRFIKKSNENSALFHFFPGAIYEFRDRVWQVKEMHGNTARSVQLGSDAFEQLLARLAQRGIDVQNYSGLHFGVSEIYPMTWYCANPECNWFLNGRPKNRTCIKCNRGEMRQVPLVVICDACGYMDQINTRGACHGRHSRNDLRLVMYEREKIGSWRLVCQRCLEESARRHSFSISRPNTFEDYEAEFRVPSDLDPGSPCRSCNTAVGNRNREGKRIVPAGANVVAPAFDTAFDKNMQNIMATAKSTASKNMSVDENHKDTFKVIQDAFGIKEIYLSDINALSCTYGYRVGRHNVPIAFQGNTIYLKSDHCEAIVIEFNDKKIPQQNRADILHAAAHALLQVAGYITGLGNEVYREHVDVETCSIMIFTVEGGGCELLVNEPAKLITWLKQARAIVHGCKNQCENGCPWCLHLRTFQCDKMNRELNRPSLEKVWSKPIGV